MEIVENILEVSSKLGSIQQFCEFGEDTHKITKCNDDCCNIRIYNDLLRTTVFDPELDYDYRINFFVKNSVEYHKVYQSMLQLQNKCKEKVKKFVESKKPTELQKCDEDLLTTGTIKKKKLKDKLTP